MATYKPLKTEISAADSAGVGSKVYFANNVRAVNTSTTTAYEMGVADSAALGRAEADHTLAARMTLPPSTVHILRKDKDDVVFASNAAVKFAKITNPDG